MQHGALKFAFKLRLTRLKPLPAIVALQGAQKFQGGGVNHAFSSGPGFTLDVSAIPGRPGVAFGRTFFADDLSLCVAGVIKTDFKVSM